jgi:peptide/nickel transport system substrate-binding protein
MKRKLLLLLTFVMLLVSACGSSTDTETVTDNTTESTDSSSTQEPLVVNLVAEPVSMDPHQVNDINSHRVHYLMYDTLVGWDDKGFNMIPQLAETWTISDDGLEYVFKLRSGVTFHDGTEVNAEAVKFTFEHMLNKEHPDYNGPYPLADVYYGVIDKIETPDNLTVKFILKKKNGPFLNYLTATSAAIVSPDAVKKAGKDVAISGTGSGPYILEQWEKGVKVVLKANPDYWAGAPKNSAIIIEPVVEPLVRVTKLKTGEADIIADVDPDSIEDLVTSKYNVLQQPGPHLWYVTLNASKKPFNDVRVRQAMNYAVDKESIVNDILRGTGVVATQPLSPVYNGHDPSIEGYDYDPEKAKKLLAEAGYADGFKVTFLIPESGSGMQSPVAMCTAVQDYLKAVGVDVEIQKMEWGAFLGTSQNEKNRGENAPYEMWAISWMNVTGDPDGTLANLYSANNMPLFNSGFYKNDEVTRLLDEAAIVNDLDSRTSLYQQASRIITDEAPMIFMDYGKQTAATSDKISGFELHPSHMLNLRLVTK